MFACPFLVRGATEPNVDMLHDVVACRVAVKTRIQIVYLGRTAAPILARIWFSCPENGPWAPPPRRDKTRAAAGGVPEAPFFLLDPNAGLHQKPQRIGNSQQDPKGGRVQSVALTQRSRCWLTARRLSLALTFSGFPGRADSDVWFRCFT